jgi:hypothetical protein
MTRNDLERDNVPAEVRRDLRALTPGIPHGRT